MSENAGNGTSTDIVIADMEKNMAVVVKDDLDQPPRTSNLKAPNLELIGHRCSIFSAFFSRWAASSNCRYG